MLRVVLIFSLLMGLTACSNTSEWKGVYTPESKEKISYQLDVPPDLSEPDVSEGLTLPNISGGSTYSAYKTGSNTGYKGDIVTPANPKGAKVIRDGANQWLEINSSAEELWPQLKVFFTKVGFEIKREDKRLGIIDTNWLENRIDLPTNWFTRLIKKLDSSGLRDKYRARLEKTNKPNVTLVFITHQGLKEVGEDYTGEEIAHTLWQPRQSDPELEAEMYQRFLIFRDVSKDQAISLVDTTTAVTNKRTKFVEKEGNTLLQVNEGFARTWRRVGIALDRIGLLVDDRDRSDGLYYLRITEDFRDKAKEDDGWLASLFSSKKVKLRDRYLLSVSNEGETTFVGINETTGAKADADFVKQLLTDLQNYLD